MGGLNEAPKQAKDHTPHVEGDLKREAIERTNNFGQAGETYRRFSEFERNELITNLVNTLSTCKKDIQDQMIENFTKADPDYGNRVAEGLKKPLKTTATDRSARQKPLKPLSRLKKKAIRLIRINLKTGPLPALFFYTCFVP